MRFFAPRCIGRAGARKRQRLLLLLAVAHLLAMRGARQAWRHPTHLAVQSSPACRVPSTWGGTLCARARLLCPPTGRCQRLAAWLARAREGRARGRGRTRQPGVTVAIAQQARAGGQARGQTQGEKASAHLGVHRRRVRTPSRVLARGASPGWSREAQGSPALRPEVRRSRARSTAVVRLRMSETARASVGARRVRAGPGRGFGSQRASSGWP
jgi:hypothetical protein